MLSCANNQTKGGPQKGFGPQLGGSLFLWRTYGSSSNKLITMVVLIPVSQIPEQGLQF
jgi:hypothetical protein